MMEEVPWPFNLHMQCIIITIVIAAINRVPSVPRSSAKTLYISYLILKKPLFISFILQMMKPKLTDVTNMAKILVIKWQSGISNTFLSVSRVHNLNYYVILPFITCDVGK